MKEKKRGKCLYCNNNIVITRSWTKFCNRRCRVRHFRSLRKLPNKNIEHTNAPEST